MLIEFNTFQNHSADSIKAFYQYILKWMWHLFLLKQSYTIQHSSQLVRNTNKIEMNNTSIETTEHLGNQKF